MILEPDQRMEKSAALLQRLWNTQSTRKDQREWTNSNFYSPVEGNNSFGLMTPSYSLCLPPVPENPPGNDMSASPPQAMYNGVPCTRLVARFPGYVESGERRTAKILEEEEPQVEKAPTIRTRPVIVKAEDNNSAIPYYPTISAHWDEGGKKKRKYPWCCTDFLYK